VASFLISIGKEVQDVATGAKKSLRLAFGIDVVFHSGRLFCQKENNERRALELGAEEASESDSEQKEREAVKMCVSSA